MKGTTRTFVIALAMATILATVATGAAVAAKGNNTHHGGGGTTGGSYSVTVTPGAPYSVGELVYTTTDAPIYPNGAGPWIAMVCSVNGVAQVGWTHAGFPGGWYYNWPYKLDGWGGGPADCTVTVFHQSNNKSITDATASFHVG